MKYEWFVVKYKDGKAVDKTPHAMTKDEAKNLARMGPNIPGNNGFTFKAVHRHDVAI